MVGRCGEVIKAPEDFAAIGTAIIVTIARGEHDARVETGQIVCIIVIYNIFAVVVNFYSTAREKKSSEPRVFGLSRPPRSRGDLAAHAINKFQHLTFLFQKVNA